jgi:hypothetical protein
MAKPFETAGFKTLLLRKTHHERRRSDFSPEDIRYSVIRYVASTTRNAIGPVFLIPEQEIIESDIIWYHNHLRRIEIAIY